MIRNLVVFIVFLLACQFLAGQIVNIENKRIYNDTTGWSGAVDAGFSMSQNQYTLMSYNFRPKVQYTAKKHYVLLLTELNYSKGNSTVYSNNGMAHLRYAYRLPSRDSTRKNPWKWESYAQVQYNQLLDQRLRTLAGTGLRLRVLNKKKYRMFVGSSGFLEHEEVRSNDSIIRGFRSSSYFSWYFTPKSTFSFTGVTYYQPLFATSKDFRLMGQYTLNFHVFKRTDLKWEFNMFYDSRPNTDVKNWALSMSFGVHINLESKK